MAKNPKTTNTPKSRRFWPLKLALVLCTLLLGFTFIPGQFIPAGPIGNVYEALREARDRTFGLAKETGGKAVDRVAEEIAERREPTITASGSDTITVCSFNVQFLGSSKTRDDEALTSILRGYDIVVVQELVAPPYPATFPDGDPVKPDPEAAEFSMTWRRWASLTGCRRKIRELAERSITTQVQRSGG